VVSFTGARAIKSHDISTNAAPETIELRPVTCTYRLQLSYTMEANMIRIRVEYDGYNRKFKLLDREFGPMLLDGAVYELSVPLTTGIALQEIDEFVCIDGSGVAQA
jgi:hypothetical protein